MIPYNNAFTNLNKLKNIIKLGSDSPDHRRQTEFKMPFDGEKFSKYVLE